MEGITCRLFSLQISHYSPDHITGRNLTGEFSSNNNNKQQKKVFVLCFPFFFQFSVLSRTILSTKSTYFLVQSDETCHFGQL